MADAWTTLVYNSTLDTGDAWEHLNAQMGKVVSNLLGSAITEEPEYEGIIVVEEIEISIEEIAETETNVLIDEITVMVPKDGNTTGTIIETNINGDTYNAY